MKIWASCHSKASQVLTTKRYTNVIKLSPVATTVPFGTQRHRWDIVGPYDGEYLRSIPCNLINSLEPCSPVTTGSE